MASFDTPLANDPNARLDLIAATERQAVVGLVIGAAIQVLVYRWLWSKGQGWRIALVIWTLLALVYWQQLFAKLSVARAEARSQLRTGNQPATP